MEKWNKVIKIHDGEFRAEDYEVGTEVHGWTVVIAWEEKYFHWASPSVINPDPR